MATNTAANTFGTIPAQGVAIDLTERVQRALKDGHVASKHNVAQQTQFLPTGARDPMQSPHSARVCTHEFFVQSEQEAVVLMAHALSADLEAGATTYAHNVHATCTLLGTLGIPGGPGTTCYYGARLYHALVPQDGAPLIELAGPTQWGHVLRLFIDAVNAKDTTGNDVPPRKTRFATSPTAGIACGPQKQVEYHGIYWSELCQKTADSEEKRAKLAERFLNDVYFEVARSHPSFTYEVATRLLHTVSINSIAESSSGIVVEYRVQMHK